MNVYSPRVVVGPILAAFVGSASCGSASVPAAPSAVVEPPPAVRRIVVLGDSLAVSPSRAQGFPAELQRRLDSAGGGWTVVNAGISGDTTAGGLRRFDQAVPSGTAILVLALGANDGLRGVPIGTIEENLSAIIARAQAQGARVLLCGMETPPTRGWEYTVEYHRLFRRVAAAHDVPLVPFLLDGVALIPEMNGADGIHPNAAGARRIAETVWPYLAALVRGDGVVAG